MDTTETYIKMCDCEEIQEAHPQLMIGSTTHYYKGVYQCEIDTSGNVRYWPPNGKRVWLPRQDQLQEMHPNYRIFGGNPKLIVSALHHHIDEDREGKYPKDYWYDFISREQLELAFVMKEKHGKIWIEDYWEVEVFSEVSNASTDASKA